MLYYILLMLLLLLLLWWFFFLSFGCSCFFGCWSFSRVSLSQTHACKHLIVFDTHSKEAPISCSGFHGIQYTIDRSYWKWIGKIELWLCSWECQSCQYYIWQSARNNVLRILGNFTLNMIGVRKMWAKLHLNFFLFSHTEKV